MNFLSSLFKFFYNKFSDKETTKEILILEGVVSINKLNNKIKI